MHPHNIKYLLLFHCNSGCMNIPKCYVIHTEPVLLNMSLDIPVSTVKLFYGKKCSGLCADYYQVLNQKVTGLIPNGVIAIFHWHNSSGCTIALGLTQPLTEMSIRIFPGGKGGWCVGLTTFMCQLSWNLGTSASWNPQSLSRPVMGLVYLFTLLPGSALLGFMDYQTMD